MKDLFKLVGALIQLAWALALAIIGAGLLVSRLIFAIVTGIVSVPARLLRGRAQGTGLDNINSDSGPAFTMQVGGARDKANRPPPPPSLAEYHAAGVNPDLCSLCQKQMPGRQREWKYLVFDGRPAIICPRCWAKNVSNATPAEAAAFTRRISSRWWNNPRV